MILRVMILRSTVLRFCGFKGNDCMSDNSKGIRFHLLLLYQTLVTDKGIPALAGRKCAKCIHIKK